MNSSQKSKRIYITWDRYSSRSDSTAYFFQARSYCIESIKIPLKFYLPLKYTLAALRTVTILYRERPDIIFVQNPPPIAVLVVWFYCLLFGSKYIPDTHSGAFTSKRWALFLWLYRFLSKRALTNILHNDYFVNRVKEWGASAVNLGAVPRQMKTGKIYPLRDGFNAVFPCSFSGDEPVEEVILAAGELRNVNFYITGNLSRAPKELTKNVPSNIVFTDFLPHEDYVALLKACNVVICLTNRDLTNQSGAYEAIAIGRPIIVSNWPLLREIYYRGTVHIDNKSISLVNAIKAIQNNYAHYLDEIKLLKEEGLSNWEKNHSELLNLLKTT
jgi:glycosyltransferase involved in cell wall biosynthesis